MLRIDMGPYIRGLLNGGHYLGVCVKGILMGAPEQGTPANRRNMIVIYLPGCSYSDVLPTIFLGFLISDSQFIPVEIEAARFDNFNDAYSPLGCADLRTLGLCLVFKGPPTVDDRNPACRISCRNSSIYYIWGDAGFLSSAVLACQNRSCVPQLHPSILYHYYNCFKPHAEQCSRIVGTRVYTALLIMSL